MLSPEEVRNIAELSRLSLSPEEVEHFRAELSAVVDFFEGLKSLPEGGSAEPRVPGLARPDVAVSVSDEVRRRIRENFPETREGSLVVPSVLGEENT
jgi:aspartyl/glutamyl-tRNA(Asn/Gln) amidotransferase C subunit